MTPTRFSVALAVTLTVSGCGGSAGGTPKTVTVGGDRISVAQLASVVGGLCETRRAVTDVTSARTAFYNHAHENLHLLARAVEASERRAAGRVLEAKQRVEGDLTSPGSPQLLTKHVNELLSAARAALDRLDIPSRSCSEADPQ